MVRRKHGVNTLSKSWQTATCNIVIWVHMFVLLNNCGEQTICAAQKAQQCKIEELLNFYSVLFMNTCCKYSLPSPWLLKFGAPYVKYMGKSKKTVKNGNDGITPEVSFLSSPRKQNNDIQFGFYTPKIVHSQTIALTKVVIMEILAKLS